MCFSLVKQDQSPSVYPGSLLALEMLPFPSTVHTWFVVCSKCCPEMFLTHLTWQDGPSLSTGAATDCTWRGEKHYAMCFKGKKKKKEHICERNEVALFRLAGPSHVLHEGKFQDTTSSCKIVVCCTEEICYRQNDISWRQC